MSPADLRKLADALEDFEAGSKQRTANEYKSAETLRALADVVAAAKRYMSPKDKELVDAVVRVEAIKP